MKRWLMILGVLLLVGVGATAGRMMFPIVIEPAPPLPPEVIEVEVVREIEVEGPERVVERVRWRTREVPVEVEVVREITRYVEKADDGPERLFGRVRIDADKYEGACDAGICFGWKGQANCQIKGDEEAEWLTLVSEPFSLDSSRVETTIAPVVKRAFRWRVEARGGVNSEGGWNVAATYYPWKRLGFYGDYQRFKSSTSSYEPVYNDYRIKDVLTVVTAREIQVVTGGIAVTVGQLR